MTVTQLTAFPTGPMSRATDPDTSRSAAPSAHHLSAVQARVLALFADGAAWTDEQVCDRLPDVYAPTCKKRRSELAKAGLLVDRGVRRLTRQGREAIVWCRP